MQNQMCDYGRQAAEALAEVGATLPAKRDGAEGQALSVRVMEFVWDVAIAMALCTASFWIAREVMAVWSS